MRRMFILMSGLILLCLGLISCSPSVDPVPDNSQQPETSSNPESPAQPGTPQTPVVPQRNPGIVISYDGNTVYTNAIFMLDITFTNFSSTPTNVDIYVEGSTTPFMTNVSVNSGKVTVVLPNTFFGNAKIFYVKVGNTESNHLNVKFIYVINTENLETFINSIDTNETVKIKVLGSVRTIQNRQFLKNENIRLNLDFSEVSGLYTLYSDKYFGSMRECNSIEYIIMPNEITVLELKQFYNCKNLRGIEIPNGVRDLDWKPTGTESGSTFEGCEKLEEIRLPENLVDIATKSFYRCSSLKEITIPASVTYIGSYAFNKSGVRRISFLNKTGWKVNGNDISEQELTNPENVASLLKNQNGYYNRNWTRSN